MEDPKTMAPELGLRPIYFSSKRRGSYICLAPLTDYKDDVLWQLTTKDNERSVSVENFTDQMAAFAAFEIAKQEN